LEANQLLVIQNDDEAMKLPFGPDMEPNEIRFLPVWWVDTPVQALEMRVAEIFAEVDKEMAELPTGQLLEKIKDMAEKSGHLEKLFQAHEDDRDGQTGDRLPECPRQACEKGYVFKYDHLAQPEGFMGAQFKWEEGMVALTQDNMARLWAYCRVAAHAVGKSL
jgi:hypothetical protein